MNLTPDLQDLIEQYLQQQLTGQALVDFEERLATDKELAAEVNFQKDLHELLAVSSENALRKNLELLSEQAVVPKKKEDRNGVWWFFSGNGGGNLLDRLLGQPQRQLVWLLPLLVAMGWWLYNGNKPIDPQDPMVGMDTLIREPFGKPIDVTPDLVEETPDKTIPNEINKDSLNPSNLAQEELPQKKPTPQRDIPKLLPPPTIIPQTEDKVYGSIEPPASNKKDYDLSTPPTIFWHDSTIEPILDAFDLATYFGEKADLESLIAQNFKQEKVQLEVLQKPKIAYLSTDTSNALMVENDLLLQLKLQTSDSLLNRELVLYMKDNQGNPYGPFSLAGDLQAVDDSTYVLSTNLKLWDKTPRLAYYSIADYQTEAVYFTEKLAVIPQDSLLNKFLFPIKGDYTWYEVASTYLTTGEEPDFFAPIPSYQALIAKNGTNKTETITFNPPLPDTIFASQIDSLPSIIVTLQTKDDLMRDNLFISVVDNQDWPIPISNNALRDSLKKRFGTDTYLFSIIPYSGVSKDGLYYFTIEGFWGEASKIYYTGKIIYITDNE